MKSRIVSAHSECMSPASIESPPMGDRRSEVARVMAPKVSVAVSLYNKAAYIEDTLRSALAQSFSDIEIVVVDDGSTDDGAERVARLNDTRLVLIRQANTGAAAARNRALANAKAPFVAFLDADDIWLADHLLHLTALAEQFPHATLLGNRFVQTCGTETPPVSQGTVEYRELEDYFAECVFSQEPFFTSSCMVRRDRALELGGFPVGEFCGEDLALWIKLAAADRVAVSGYVGCCYRRHPGSLSFQPFYRNASDISMSVLDELLVQNPDWPARRRYNIREFYCRIALAHCLDCLIAGEMPQARRFLKLSAQTEALRSRWRKAKLLALTPKPVRNLVLSLRS